jgi:hypothetical protein
MAQQPLVVQGHSIEASRSHLDTPESVRLLWTSDQPDAETSTWQNTIRTTERHPYPRRDSNLRRAAPHKTLDRAVNGIDSGTVYADLIFLSTGISSSYWAEVAGSDVYTIFCSPFYVFVVLKESTQWAEPPGCIIYSQSVAK